MTGFKENVIEWITGQERATLSLSQRRTITRVKKLAEQYPDKIQIVAENRDGSICAHMPMAYIRFAKPVELTEEEKARRTALLADGRAKIEQNSSATTGDEDLYLEDELDEKMPERAHPEDAGAEALQRTRERMR